jgi:nucleoside-diphosphate-sugar epimerase
LSPRGDARAPADAAAAAVRSMEAQVLDATRRGAIQGVVLRYGMFYGVENPSTAAMIEMVRKRRLPAVRGDAGQLPFIHLDDAVDATVRALDRAPAGAVYEIVDDRAMSLSQVVEAMARYAGAPAPWHVPAWVPKLAAPYMARLISLRVAPSNARAKADLGWAPKYATMAEGLAAMFPRAA